jgi:peptidyl-prolyl cis-trans isomerase B (cyclophilin B)
MGKGWKRFIALSLTVCCAAVVGCGTQGEPKTSAKPAAINGGSPAATASGTDAASAAAAPALSGPRPGTPLSAAPSGPPADPLHPRVRIETSLGDVLVELDGANAELTVSHFLTNYVDAGYYAHTIFHQVFKGYVIVGGSFTPEGKEKPAKFSVRSEAHNGLKNVRGTIAMARQADARDSARAQFFINVADNPALDHKDDSSAAGYGYCVFGHVVQGLDVVDRIANSPVKDAPNFESTPIESVLIKAIHRAP